MSPNLTPKRERFVDEYLVDLNATQAAIRAGYSARSAEVTGSVDVLQSAELEPGCTVLTCKRCHAKWRVCPVGLKAA